MAVTTISALPNGMRWNGVLAMGARFRGGWDKIMLRVSQARAEAELERLSDHLLQDLGIQRADIMKAIRGDIRR